MTSTIVTSRGLPGYTFERAAGEVWRSRFDAERNQNSLPKLPAKLPAAESLLKRTLFAEVVAGNKPSSGAVRGGPSESVFPLLASAPGAYLLASSSVRHRPEAAR